MNRYTKYVALVISFLMMFAIVPEAAAQEDEPLICSQCEYGNDMANQFCVSCGESLSDEYSQRITEKQSEARHKRRFISERVDPPRLFSVPSARVLRSMDIRLMGGGAFGVATDKSFLGTVGIGLGDIAEVEFSTIGMVNNIARGSTVFPTSAFKIMIIPENKWHIPTLAVAFRSSANWAGVQSDSKVLRANFRDFVEFDDSGNLQNISAIGYDTRFTTMYGVTTLKLWFVSLHAGVSLTDVRVKELLVSYQGWDSRSDPGEKQKNLIGGFVGLDIESNPQTKSMFELRTVSNYEYNTKSRKIEVSEALLAIGGVRFFFNRWLSTDVGVLYLSTFKGIADLQIKMSLNIFIPGGNLGSKLVRFRRR